MMIYLDHHSTTPLDPDVLDAMLPYMTTKFGNPSSIDHTYGHEASVAVEDSRQGIANLIGADSDDIVFTSGATESNNMALLGIAKRYAKRGNHIITCTTEHHAILDTARYLEREGIRISHIPVDNHGIIDADILEETITPDTILISVMAANNEIGTIPDIENIGCIARQNDILFHTDAAQAVGHIDMDVDTMNIDMMSISAHKMCGPKGVGALYVRGANPAVRLEPLMHGGGQEGNQRSGTLNVPGIVGFGKAVQIADKVMASERRQHRDMVRAMLDRFEDMGGVLNGHPESRLAHNLNVRFEGIEGKAIINSVSDRLAISAGSACTTQTVEPSHVLMAIGLDVNQAHQSIRFGLGRFTTKAQTEEAVDIIQDAIDSMPR